MRIVILALIAPFLWSCSTQKKVETAAEESLALSRTTVSALTDTALLDAVSSLSYNFDSLEVCFVQCDTVALRPGIYRLTARRASIKGDKSLKKENRTVAIAGDTVVANCATLNRNKENSDSAKLYKPPDASTVLVIAIFIAFSILIYRLRK